MELMFNVTTAIKPSVFTSESKTRRVTRVWFTAVVYVKAFLVFGEADVWRSRVTVMGDTE